MTAQPERRQVLYDAYCAVPEHQRADIIDGTLYVSPRPAPRSTESIDRHKKLPLYARHGVPHVWLIDPIAKTLEVHTLGDDDRWRDVRIHEGDVRVRAEPFAAIEIDLSALWVR